YWWARIHLRHIGRLELYHRLQHVRHEPQREVVEVHHRAFELARVLDGAGRARLDAQPAVHALADVDVEALHPQLRSGLSVALDDVDVDDGDGARALASLARGADVQVQFQEAAVARR